MTRRWALTARSVSFFAFASVACGSTPPPTIAVVGTPPAIAMSAPTSSGRMPAPAPARPIGDVPPDAEKRPNGLAWKIAKTGQGSDHPSEFDDVIVHYSGWTSDGELFDKNNDVTFGVREIIPGFTEALKLMLKGEKRRVWIPSELAYGESPRGVAPAGDLVFDVELVDIVVKPKPPPTPDDMAAAPKTAKKTKSGLAYRVLSKGTGKEHPTAKSHVTVQYTGWTTDGKMFDSSIPRGAPTQFPLTAVIKGWIEGVQLMVEGETSRFWIPADLAYGNAPKRTGAPAGTLVFDIELLSIEATIP